MSFSPVTIAHRPLRVVVIGAGLAGLAAARQVFFLRYSVPFIPVSYIYSYIACTLHNLNYLHLA